ncbi:DUF1572 family protein [Flavihumibacter petaseus]|uniref:DUF1572 domain-containing protein n=1 Tax=Flavihumibacter petaseus NBRC 106054 TaxID=1220578 RepID=A0A0E9N0S0_9BACT|nr:DUF1572 family protein [Flavihumibacter petaseus]GAO42955.1 hypothetical protein FPE01S_02_00600 [Flavihumibacter petaseus NBRC 106054]
MTLQEIYIQSVLSRFRGYKDLADKAIAQLTPEEMIVEPAPGANSVAVIVHHMVGNMLSRFTDFGTSDGEKEWRNRDSEFLTVTVWEEAAERIRWEDAWSVLFSNLEKLKPGDLEKKVTIRHEPHTAIDAINRQLAHYAYHVGQIVFLAKIIRKEQWSYLSIPPDASAAFNQTMEEKFRKPE